MSDLHLILRGGYAQTGDDLLYARFKWTSESAAAAQRAISEAIPAIVAALYPEDADAPPCPKCSKPMAWSKDRRRWRCHYAHKMPTRLSVARPEEDTQ